LHIYCGMQSLNSRNAKAIYSPNNKVPRFLVAAVQKYVILNLFYVSKHRTSELLEFVGKKSNIHVLFCVVIHCMHCYAERHISQMFSY